MKAYITLITIFIFGSAVLYAQQAGDYRSIASGNWTSVGIWETYNGTTWGAATSYPGQLTGTNDVFIIGGNSVSISSTILNTINSILIGDGTAALDNFYVSGTSSLNTQLVTIANGGHAEWISNVSLSLPAGASFQINPGGELATDRPCSASKRLIIGATVYSTCNGGAGAQYDFTDLNESGGSLSVSPTSDSPICEGEILNLYANPSGTGATGASFLWTGPNGFTATTSDATVSGLAQGDYTYTVTITDSAGNTNTKSVTATVLATPQITSTTPGSRNGSGTVLLNAMASSGVLNWFSNASGGSSLGTGFTFMTPSISATTTFYVEASENGCVSARVPVMATINGVTDVIINPRITYRVKIN
tara:strand:+ start:768 stop:1856 length:1089 start_codon:yes stop_codon:yes gene_type:complete